MEEEIERKTRLTFAGAAGTVTGSRYLLETGKRRVLLDCGLFQGYKQLRLRNRAKFPIAPGRVHAVVLSHAHLDHSGYLPALVRDGFRGPIYATEATAELCEILLRDSAHLQEDEAEYANRHGYSKHAPAEPLYTMRDAERAIAQLRTVPFQSRFDLGDGVSAELLGAGHLLGASIVRITRGKRTLVFSGDLGRPEDTIMRAPSRIASADTLIVESTYGDRRHAPDDASEHIAATVRDTAARGGTVLIPSFAIGRAQTVMLALFRLKQRGEIPDLPVFLDSPMAINATELYRKYRAMHRLSLADVRGMCSVAKLVRTADESKSLATLRVPSVIISASGMATGGRVLHHLKRLAPDPRNSIVFVGYQAGGTRGAHLVAGAREVKIHGQWIEVRAGVEQIDSYSAHADADEIMAWLGSIRPAPRQVYLCHGEPDAADKLRQRIGEKLGWPARVPEHLETVEVEL
ncbi:MAG: MBL fold metallo-hydrolase [Burkholderiaceae bacterium]|nr:MBL fold metallo-hydrolase [Burkholderiaceae bacterium]